MSSIPSPRFYVYVLARPNGKPFYVGKGKDSRVFRHELEAKRGHKCHKCNAIRKIWKQGGEVQRYIVFTTDDEQEALDYERETIALYGRANLTNCTDGGDSVDGMSEASNLIRKQKVSACWKNPTYRANIMKNRHSEEGRKRVGEKMKAKWQTAEFREKMANIVRTPEEKERTRQKRSEKAKTRWKDPIFRERVAQTHGMAASERMKRAWADPVKREEIRAKDSARIKALWQDPEYRAKMMAWHARRKKQK